MSSHTFQTWTPCGVSCLGSLLPATQFSEVSTMLRRPFNFAGVVLAVLLCRNELFADTWVVEPKPSQERRLSPELYLVQQSEAELVGVACDGKAVFRGKSHCSQRVRSMAASMSVQVPQLPKKATRLLLRYQANGELPADETLTAAGLKRIEDYRQGSFLIVEPEATVTMTTVNALMADEAVLFAAPDYIMSVPTGESIGVVQAMAAGSTPADPAYPDLWGLKNMGAPQAWASIREAPKIIVAVIDTGVDYNHPDLKANMWSKEGKYGYDFFDDDDDPMDEQDHGTHCAGTIAGVGNNGIGVVGVSWKAQIMAMRFMGPDGSGATSDAVKCIDWAVANGAHILSNSWAGPGSSQELVDAVTRAERKGVLFVAAAGNTANGGNNNDVSPNFPASLSNANVISVGAIDVNNARGSFSHFGKRSVDIGAPGVRIVSTVRNNQYAGLDGTSMAAPHVAGAAVLIWAKTFSNPVQDPNQMVTVRDLIYANARSVPALRDAWGQSAPARVPGGVLDISFLGKAAPGNETFPPSQPPTQPAEQARVPVVASVRFASGQITATQSGTIASARISLREPSIVHIVANSNVSSDGGASRFATGFSDKQPVGEYWQESIRNPQLRADGSWVNLGSNMSIQLPAGDHTIHWKVWLGSGATLKFSSGSMLIQATPVTVGSREVAKGAVPRINSSIRVTRDQLAQEFP